MRFITSRKQLSRAIATLAAVLSLMLLGSSFAQAAPPQILQAATVSKACRSQVLSIGKSGSCVKQAQRVLIKKGISVGPAGPDGHYGYDSDRAVRKYQKRFKLEADGVVGPQTWGHMLKSTPVTAPPPRDMSCAKLVLTLGSRGACVAQLQELLVDRGEWIGSSGADGSFGYGTLRGLTHFQKLTGLEPDGYAGPLTWDELLNGKAKLNHLNKRCFSAGSWLCVDKSDQKTYALEDGKLLRIMPTRTGGWHKFRGKWMKHETPNGIYQTVWRVKDAKSNIYDGSPMPYSQFVNMPIPGIAFHGSPSFVEDGNAMTKKGQLGSGGCINLMTRTKGSNVRDDAKWLWETFGNGTGVVTQS